MLNLLYILFFCVYSSLLIAQDFNGFALYNSQGSNTTYLIDENQNIAHTWNLSTECNYTVLLKKNGNLIRGTKYNGNILNGAASGGRVQEIDPNGNIVWDYIYSDANVLSHHDLTLIGDNVLLTAWEVKSVSDLNAAGYSNANSEKWPTHFIELEPDGNGSANIVWEWHIWDHLCQDVDPNKPNYVSDISDHPELIDINMISGGGPGGGGPGGGGPGGGGGDWFHVNGVNYNEELDQIVFSSRHASEIYIIDHSTTTLEAAGHNGGNSGMGGDILYRWGNPSNYGISGQQVINSAVHDARWIANDGRPNGGYLQIFNNSGGGSGQSTVDGIDTPLDPSGYNYLRTPGQAFEPSSYTTRYVCDYSAPGQSASDRMSNGNIYVNASGGQGGSGVMYEVDSLGNIVWGPYNSQSQKGFRYECNYPGIIALESYINTNTTSCFSSGTNITENILDIDIYPNPVNRFLNINFSKVNSQKVNLICVDLIGRVVYDVDYSIYPSNEFVKLDFSNLQKGLYILQLNFEDGNSLNKKININ